ncbi:MAG: CoA transferase, partial [Pseudomonadota bacterium]|nr:CoA transferase [Pseudomonadota bacterium]
MGPLEGYRVIDLTTMISGPAATMILGDQGADVIKIEKPDGGDHVRKGGNQRGGLSANFCNNNRNKRSVILDLKEKEGKEALLQLTRTADVFIHNFRPGVVERLGIDERMIRKHRKDII